MPTNAQIINAALGDDYTERIPQATRTNLDDIAGKILAYEPAKNKFLNTIYNKVAITLISKTEFDNPFQEFKGQDITYGDTIEDIHVPISSGYQYDDTNEDPFGQVAQSVITLYHAVNSELQYKCTIKDDILRKAIRTEGGLTQLINDIVSQMSTAANYDEYLQTVKVLSNDSIYGKQVKLGNLTGETPTKAELTKLYRAMRDVASEMKFMATDNNVSGAKAITPLNDQVIVMTAKMKDAIDMDVLAGVYNLSKVEMSQKIIEIPEFIAQNKLACVIFDRRGLRIHNALKGSDGIYNPQGRYTNYFLNDWNVFSFSLYRNCVAIKFDAAA